MAIYAKILSGIVIDDIIAESTDFFDPAFVWVDITSVVPPPQLGWTYDGTNFAFAGQPNDIYGNAVTLTTDGTHDYYAVAGYPVIKVPNGTPQAAAYLAMAIQENMFLFQAALQSFVDGQYSLDLRFNFNAIYILATQNGLTNRAAYITQLFTWAQAVVSYAGTYIAAVKALTNPTTVAGTVWDFSTLLANDPLISPAAALLISN